MLRKFDIRASRCGTIRIRQFETSSVEAKAKDNLVQGYSGTHEQLQGLIDFCQIGVCADNISYVSIFGVPRSVQIIAIMK